MTEMLHILAKARAKPFESWQIATRRAEAKVDDLGGEAWVPRALIYKRGKTVNGKRSSNKTAHWSPILGGCMVIRCSAAGLRPILDGAGVASKFQTMSDNDVAQFAAFEAEVSERNRQIELDFRAWKARKRGEAVPMPAWTRGELLEVTSGPFAQMVARFEGFVQDEGGTMAEGWVEILGGEVSTRFPVTDLSSVAEGEPQLLRRPQE